MKRDAKQIVGEIVKLLSELAELAGAPIGDAPLAQTKITLEKGEKDNKSGATGGIRLLIEEGKLDSPKKLPEIADLLRQDGRHYSNPTVSMGLLNLVRERVLTRFKDNGDSTWKYAIRR